VAIELARDGITTVGVDADASMIASAPAAPARVRHADLVGLGLDRRFDVVVLAATSRCSRRPVPA
jgi:hypothetical protein